MMIPFKRKTLSAAMVLLGLSACGGDGGAGGGISLAGSPPPASGISGSGNSVEGTISGFGSIFVNGIEFETDDAEIFRDGQPVTEDQLGIGMVVLIRGEVNDDGTTGTASVIVVDGFVEGPIDQITVSANGDSKQLSVLGIDVIVERTGTVFDDVTFDTLAVGDVVEVSGFPETGNNLRATRVEKESDFIAGETAVELEGVVANPTDTTFTLGRYSVDYSAADVSDLNGQNLQNGDTVEVYGTLVDLTITATKVEFEDDVIDDVEIDDDVSIEGTISDFVDSGDFKVNGIAVDGSAAAITPAGFILANGSIVEVEGVWDGQLLIADSIETRRGRIEIEATVSGVDSAAGQLTLGLGGNAVVVTVTSRTLFDDDTDRVERFTIDDIVVGDFLEVEAYQDGDTLVATRVDRDDSDDEITVQGLVEGFTPGVDITVFGTAYDVLLAEFEDDDGNEIVLNAFFDLLAIGDLIKIEADAAAPTFALEVEFESADRPDGGLEFDDDDDDDFDDDSDDD